MAIKVFMEVRGQTYFGIFDTETEQITIDKASGSQPNNQGTQAGKEYINPFNRLKDAGAITDMGTYYKINQPCTLAVSAWASLLSGTAVNGWLKGKIENEEEKQLKTIRETAPIKRARKEEK